MCHADALLYQVGTFCAEAGVAPGGRVRVSPDADWLERRFQTSSRMAQVLR
jgi:hypothetical protein